MGKGPGLGSLGSCGTLSCKARLGHSPERRGLPVGLLCLLPHDHVEAAAVLIAEEKACEEVIIGHSVHMEGAFKVHTVEGCISWGGWRGGGIRDRGSKVS